MISTDGTLPPSASGSARRPHRHQTVRLAAPSLRVTKVLRSTGLDRSFTICPDLAKNPPFPFSSCR